MHLEARSWMRYVNMSKTKIKRQGLKVDPYITRGPSRTNLRQFEYRQP